MERLYCDDESIGDNDTDTLVKREHCRVDNENPRLDKRSSCIFCVMNVLALRLNAIFFSAGASYQYLLSERDVHLRTHGNGNSPPASEELLKL